MNHRYATSSDSYSRTGSSAWGWILLYGVILIAIGYVAFTNMLASAVATGVLLGASLAIYGVVAVIAGFSAMAGRGRWIEVALGLIALIAGIVTLTNPVSGAVSLVWLIGAWLLVAGIFEVISVVKISVDRGWRLFMGVMDIVLGGILFFSSPGQSLAILAVIVGISFLCRGILLVFLAFFVRRLTR